MKIDNICTSMICLGGLSMSAQQVSNHALNREEHFKKEIQFETRTKGITPYHGIVGTNIPNPSAIPQLQLGWSLKKENVSSGQKDFVFINGEGLLRIRYYYEIDFVKSKSAFLRIATNTNMTVIPYQIGPSDIGDISLVGKYNNKDRIIFLNKNVVVDVQRENSEIDILNIARWMYRNMIMVPVEDVTKQIPKPHKITVSCKKSGIDELMSFPANEATMKLRGRIGEPIVIHLDPPMGTDAYRYDFEQDWVDGVFQPVGMEGLGRLERAIRPLKAGAVIYKYLFIDRQTLLSFSGEIKIDIQP